jgi:hypothetical protein
VIAALSSTHATATARCVNPGGTDGCFSTLAGAIAASAAAGDSISVAAGTYFESNIQYNRSVDITGAGVGATIVDGAGGVPQVFKYPDFGFRVTATMSHLTIQHGFRGVNIGGGNNVTLDHVRVTANGPGTGAGIFNGASSLRLTNSTVDGNSATNESDVAGCDWGGGSGGGIASLCGGGSNFISNSTISGNTASRWGGGLIINDGLTVIENSTISDNHANFPDAGIGGGAMFLAGGSPDITVRFSTIANNTAVGVGGIWGYTAGDARVRVFATILQGNTGTNCRVDANAAAEMITSLGYNISSDASCLLLQATDRISTDAMLGALQDIGAATRAHPLQGSSPAVDRIPAFDCTATADQGRVSRPQGPGCDVGSYEYVDHTPPTLAAHGNESALATGPSGATVTYVLPGASDDVAVASVSCAPASGSQFPIGDSTVGCSAADTHGNTTQGTFIVHVAGPGEQLQALQAAVENVGPGNSLASKVESALASLAAGNRATACSKLSALLNEVRAQTGKKIPVATAAEITATVSQVRAALEC